MLLLLYNFPPPDPQTAETLTWTQFFLFFAVPSVCVPMRRSNASILPPCCSSDFASRKWSSAPDQRPPTCSLSTKRNHHFLAVSLLFIPAAAARFFFSSSCRSVYYTLYADERPSNECWPSLVVHPWFICNSPALCVCKVLMCGFASGLFPFLFSRLKFVSQFLRTCMR